MSFFNKPNVPSCDGSNIDLSSYQTKTDERLTTTDKTIVGAVNEIDESMSLLELSYTEAEKRINSAIDSSNTAATNASNAVDTASRTLSQIEELSTTVTDKINNIVTEQDITNIINQALK